MNKNKLSVLTIFIIAVLLVIYTMASTYAVIIEVKDEEGVNQIVNKISIRDLVTNEDGTYNEYYYKVKNELSISETEATLLIHSGPLNENLQVVLKSIVDYKLNNDINAKLDNDELYNLIVEGVNKANNLSDELKNKVITKSNIYKQDISDFVYNIEVKLLGDEE